MIKHCFSTILPLPNNSKTQLTFKPRYRQQFSGTVFARPDPNPPPVPNPLIVEHLIQEFGVSRPKAITASKTFGRSTTIYTLAAVPKFLKENGFSDAQIKSIICAEPRILSSSVERTLRPKLDLLKDIGFSDSDIVKFVTYNPGVLRRSVENCLIPIIDTLRSFLDSDEEVVKVLQRNRWIFTCSLNTISSNVDFFRQSGIPKLQLKQLLSSHPRFFTLKPGSIQDICDRVEKMGVKKDSSTFIYALRAIGPMRKATLKAKFDLYKSYGWSEEDILSAFSKVPGFINLSEEKVRKMMSFFMDELKHEPKDIAQMPKLLIYSLEKRLKPRYKVIKILTSKGLLSDKFSIQAMMFMKDENFVEEYVNKFVDQAPDVQRAYMSSSVPC